VPVFFLYARVRRETKAGNCVISVIPSWMAAPAGCWQHEGGRTMTTAQEICDELVAYAGVGTDVTPDDLIAYAEARFGHCPQHTLQRGIALTTAELRRLAARDMDEAKQLERYSRTQPANDR
jgi:hypothetical protein